MFRYFSVVLLVIPIYPEPINLRSSSYALRRGMAGHDRNTQRPVRLNALIEDDWPRNALSAQAPVALTS
jgi:hypothetical protein